MPRYDDYSDKDKFIYAATCSRRSLGNLLLARYDQKQKLMKELVVLLEEKIAQIAAVDREIHLASLFREHGEEIIERLPFYPEGRRALRQLPELPKRVIEVPAKAQKKA